MGLDCNCAVFAPILGVNGVQAFVQLLRPKTHLHAPAAVLWLERLIGPVVIDAFAMTVNSVTTRPSCTSVGITAFGFSLRYMVSTRRRGADRGGLNSNRVSLQLMRPEPSQRKLTYRYDKALASRQTHKSSDLPCKLR